MQMTFISARRQQSAFAITIVLAFLAAALLVFASMMYWISSNAKVTMRNNQFLASAYAAEAATEKVLAYMQRDFFYQALTNESYYGALLPDMTGWPVQYDFSTPAGAANQIYVDIGPVPASMVPLNSQYSGLYGIAQDCMIAATATPVGQAYTVPATVTQQVQFASIPVFQFAIFYNIELEINPGSAMTINGKVFSNGDIYATGSSSANPLKFTDTVQAVGTYNDHRDPNDGQGTRNDNVVCTITYHNPSSGNDPLSLPLGGNSTNYNATNAEALINLPPAIWAPPNWDAAYSTNGMVYLCNRSDLIISNAWNGTNSAAGTNITIWYQDQSVSPYLFKLTNNQACTFSNTKSPYNITTTNVCALPTNYPSYTNYVRIGSSFSFVTNVLFYDARESKQVQAVQFDVAAFCKWITNSTSEGASYNATCNSHKSHPINGIFIYNNVTRTSTRLPAVRVVNGTQLYDSHGMTVITPMPLYVKGHYNVKDSTGTAIGTTNTLHTYPAALMGDSITVLSSNFVDKAVTATMGTAAATTVNAAMIEGIVQTTNSHYSGGVENFIRFLEDWTTVTNTYNGSIVVMFPSIYATNFWTGTVYGVPKSRQWGFDANFKYQNKLPPCTPSSRALIRGTWGTGLQ
jgi:hypothetical protein